MSCHNEVFYFTLDLEQSSWMCSGCCRRGSLFTSTTNIHSDFKYSMNWECHATYGPPLIYAHAVELFTPGATESSGKSATGNVESCSLSFKNELKRCCKWFDWLAVVWTPCGSVLPHTPLLSFSPPLSICSAFLCANVYARFMAPTDKERHLLLCDVASGPHD